MRRKKTAAHKASAVDDKKLTATLKKLPNYAPIAGVDELNIFKEDGSIIHFASPKVSGSTASNTFAVTGAGEAKTVQDLLPGILPQMGQAGIKLLTEQIAKGKGGLPAGLEALAASAAAAAGGLAGDDDDEAPPSLDESAAGGDLPSLDAGATF